MLVSTHSSWQEVEVETLLAAEVENKQTNKKTQLKSHHKGQSETLVMR